MAKTLLVSASHSNDLALGVVIFPVQASSFTGCLN